jgi:hypothetical protein
VVVVVLVLVLVLVVLMMMIGFILFPLNCTTRLRRKEDWEGYGSRITNRRHTRLPESVSNLFLGSYEMSQQGVIFIVCCFPRLG